MFRKALDLQGEKKYSGKDIKKLNALLCVKFGDDAVFGARANVYLRSEASCAQLITSKTDDGEDFCFGALDAKAFERGINAASNGERGKVADIDGCVIFPTLHRIWTALPERGEGSRCSTVLNTPPVLVHPDTTQFVLNGADFMAPGLQGRQYPYVEGAVVALYAIGNPLPFAVGQWQGNRTSGVAVRVYTRFGDSLWMQNPKKPEGFTPKAILPITAGSAFAPPERASGGIAEGREEEEAIVQDGCGSKEEADEEEHDPSVEPSGEDKVDASVQRDDANKESVGCSKEDMDSLLLRSFLQAAKTTLKQDSKFSAGPLPMDIFYSQYIRPARPVGSSIDVHKSSHKKVAKFIEFLKAEEMITTDKNNSVSGIVRSNPDIRGYTLHEGGDDCLARPANVGTDKQGSPSLFVEGVASSRVVFPLYSVKVELNKLFYNAEGNCVSNHTRPRQGACDSVSFADVEIFLEPVEVAPALKEYCSRHDLMVSKKLVDVKRLAIPLLLQESDGDDPKALTVDALARRILEAGTEKKQFHKVTLVSLVGEEKVSFRQGPPQRVDIRTEKRKNHNVTILQGLDARCYGYDLEKLADLFKKKFGVNTFLEDVGSAKVLVVGGFFDRDLEEMLPRDLHIPSDCVENFASARKADMRQKRK